MKSNFLFLIVFVSVFNACVNSASEPSASTLQSSKGNISRSFNLDEDWVEILEDIVEINSCSDNPAGSHKVFKRIMPIIEGIGFDLHLYEVGSGHHVLSVDIAGGNPQVVLIGHVDTVFSKNSPFQRMSQNENILKGPGVIDMKGGVIMMLHILSMIDDPEMRKKIRVLVNDDEEIGSPYSKVKLQELARGIPYGLVFEPAPEPNGVIKSSSGLYWFEITTNGRAAHAGMEHRKGINACVALAEKLVEINKLTDYTKGLTVNVGTLQGGTKPNVVCETAKALVDIRYQRRSDLDWLLETVQKIISLPLEEGSTEQKKARSKTTHIVSMPNLPEESSQELFSFAQQTGEKLGTEIIGMHSGYASDGNHLSEIGTKILVGLGPYGQGMHRTDETLDLNFYRERLVFNRELLLSILHDGALQR